MLFALAAVPSMLQSAYDEPQRPQFHFTARKGWLNDPNGLVFHSGRYHLFFQHNPFATQWGNMTWGHAVSRDLVHWSELDSALTPDETGTMFSGSAVVDKEGVAGSGKGSMVLFYTAAGGTNEASKGKPFVQCSATSTDGSTFEKNPHNPVLPHIEGENRDPKVVWHAASKTWVMALYLADDRYALFGSKDLKAWNRLCDVRVPGTGECPDFFELPVDGDRNKRLWVFWGANGNYLLGSFDGREFRPGTTVLKSNFGPNFYAAQSFFNDPKGRRIQIGWMQGSEFKGCDWNQQMSFPRTVRLKSTPYGARLCFAPVDEIRSLRARRLKGATGLSRAVEFVSETGLFEMRGRWSLPQRGKLTLNVLGTRVEYDGATQTLNVGGHVNVVPTEKGWLELTMLADRGSLEVFAQGGETTVPVFVQPTPSSKSLMVETGEGVRTSRLDVYELRSAWNVQTGRRSR